MPKAGVDASNWVVFEHTFASLFERVPKGTLSPAVKERLRGGGIDPDRPLLPAYPYAVWVHVAGVLAEAVFPTAELGLAHRQLGHLFLDGYAKTAMGIAVTGFLKVIGPRRALGRTAKAFRSGNNYFESKLDETGPGTFRLWINEEGTHPEFIAGVVQACLRLCGANQPQVEPLAITEPGRAYRVSWIVS